MIESYKQIHRHTLLFFHYVTVASVSHLYDFVHTTYINSIQTGQLIPRTQLKLYWELLGVRWYGRHLRIPSSPLYLCWGEAVCVCVVNELEAARGDLALWDRH